MLELDYNIARQIGYEDLLRTAVEIGATTSLNQLMLQMLFNYLFVNQDDHMRNFSFMCGEDFRYRATPAYDITYANGKAQTVEHQLKLYGKSLSKIVLDDVVELANEFSIEINFVAGAIEKMMTLREQKLPELLRLHNVSNKKQKEVLDSVMLRKFGE